MEALHGPGGAGEATLPTTVMIEDTNNTMMKVEAAHGTRRKAPAARPVEELIPLTIQAPHLTTSHLEARDILFAMAGGLPTLMGRQAQRLRGMTSGMNSFTVVMAR